MKGIALHVIRFLILILIQALIINQVNLPFYINPQIYVLSLLMIPVNTPHWMQLLIGVTAGYAADKFAGTMGMHMAACVFMMYVRYFFISRTTETDVQQLDIEPGISTLGIKWFLPYAGVMILLHHIILFYTEIFTFREFFSTALRVINSSIVTLLLVLLVQFLFYRNSRI